MATADVTILGAGVFGLSIGYVCARRGARVRVIDPNGVGAGASGGIVGALAPHAPELWNDKKQFQFESLIAAAPFWKGVEDLSGLGTGYARTGRLQPLETEKAVKLAQDRATQAADLWQGLAVWKIVRSDDFGVWQPRSATGLVIYDTLSARIHPRKTCVALVGAIAALGGEVVTEGATEGAVVHAKGWQDLIDIGAVLGHSFGNGSKGQAALFRYDARTHPQLFSDGLHLVPHDDGTIAVGSTTERYFDDPAATDHQLDDLIARAIAAFPFLTDAPVIERWAGVRPRSVTRAPVLGAHPLYPDQFIANGGFKIGLGMAPKVAEVMADLVLDGVAAGIPPEFTTQANLP